MRYRFPSSEWAEALVQELAADERYARVARDWEGDLLFVVEPDSQPDHEPVGLYLDLWHGGCRSHRYFAALTKDVPRPTYVLRAPRSRFLRILAGDLDPIQAMLTRRLKVEGDMVYMLRNIPTVLDFVRVCRLVPLEGEAAGEIASA